MRPVRTFSRSEGGSGRMRGVRVVSCVFSTEAWALLSGALAVSTAASLWGNYWQYRQLDTYRTAEKDSVAREISIKHKEEMFSQSQQHLQQQMELLAQRALSANNESFLTLAKAVMSDMSHRAEAEIAEKQQTLSDVVAPMKRSLLQVEQKMETLEKDRAHAFTDLRRQMIDLVASQKELRFETSNLVKALRTPTGRGQWGEMQLRRVIEMSGMVQHCDYMEQKSIQGTDETLLRPDVIVRLTDNRSIVIDAKTPLLAYLEAHDCPDDEKKSQLLKDHAKQLRTHISLLSQKAYWSQFASSPDFVVMFIPGEAIFGAALAADPLLIEYGVERRVMLATPTTLIALLRVVALGWQQKSVSDNAREIGLLGRECFKRLTDFTIHLENVGKHLSHAVSSYNQSVGSFERRVLPTAKKFQDLDPGILQGGETAVYDANRSSATELEVSSVEVAVRSLKVSKSDKTKKAAAKRKEKVVISEHEASISQAGGGIYSIDSNDEMELDDSTHTGFR